MITIKKDVGIMCQYFYPEHVSSATLPTELAIGLRERGLEVGVLCGYPQEYINDGETKIPLKETHQGVDIRRVKYTTFNNKSKFGRIFNFFSLFLAMLTKFFYLQNFKKIIVYSNPPILPLIPYAFKKLFGTEFIFVAFDIYPDNALKMNGIKENGLIHKVMNYINDKVYTNASQIILLGNEMKDYVLDNDIATTEKNLKVIPNWYSNENALANKEIINQEFRHIREAHNLVVLYSGNMGSFQDLETILNGILNFKNQNEVFFIFSGHGNKADYVKEFLVKNNVENAKVYGFLTGQDYSDVLNLSDLCLVSLEKGIEGLGVPSKTYGYLAAGKPVLSIMSSHTDIARDVIEYNCGDNILQGDVSGFERIIYEYLTYPLQLKQKSINAKKLYEAKYTRNINVEKYYKLLNN
ncbi:glycosyltransferase family 4 protein [Planococcus sp. 1R117A]|uniref:glycosyltransferase family 4 protein n=1 Tax=Planococcus sp. 1R117A TaxID=3447020 RepID=UPI003EDC14EB